MLSPGLSPWLRVCSEKTGSTMDGQQGQDTHDRDRPRPFGSGQVWTQPVPSVRLSQAGQEQGWKRHRHVMAACTHHREAGPLRWGRGWRELEVSPHHREELLGRGPPPFCTTFDLTKPLTEGRASGPRSSWHMAVFGLGVLGHAAPGGAATPVSLPLEGPAAPS